VLYFLKARKTAQSLQYPLLLKFIVKLSNSSPT